MFERTQILFALSEPEGAPLWHAAELGAQLCLEASPRLGVELVDAPA